MNANCLICVLSDDILERFVDVTSTTQPLLWNNGPYMSISSLSCRHIVLINRIRLTLTKQRIPALLSWPEKRKSYKTSVKRSIEIIKLYKVELSLKLNVVAGETFYCHFATG
jgi:hypothetical protein